MIRRYAGLLAITLIGLFLRLIHIADQPLWTDEALTLIISQWPLDMLFFAPADPTPGLYYGLHQVLLGPLVGVVGARSISVVAGTLLIPAGYFLAKKARVPALLTAALVALSFPLIDYSQEARAYSLLLLLVTVSAGLFLWWGRSKRLRLLAASLGIAILAFYTHFTAFFWLGPLMIAALWTGKRAAVPLVLAAAIAATPEVSRLSQYEGGFSWLLQAGPLQAVNTLAETVLPFRVNGFVALAVAILVGWRAWVHRSRLREWIRSNPWAGATLLLFIAMPLGIWLFGFVATPVFMGRTILVALPGYLLAIALLLSFERKPVRFAAVGLYAASLLVTGTMRPREDWRGVAGRVGNDTVLMCEIGQATALKHALSEGSRVLLAFGDGVLDIEGAPWQRAYFRALTEDEWKDRAARRGDRIARDLFPVWAVRSGSLENLGPKPTTLGQALRICDAYHASRQARYRAD